MSRLSHLALLAITAAALGACGGGGGSTATITPTTPQAEGALRAAQPGDLAADFRARLTKRVAQGLQSGNVVNDIPGTPVILVATSATAAATTVSGTTLQETGVDEDDLIKSDGNRIFAMALPWYDYTGNGMQPGQLSVYGIQGNGSLGPAASVSLGTSTYPQGMYLTGNRVAVLGQAYNYKYGGAQPDVAVASTFVAMGSPEVRLDVYEASGTTAPARSHTLSVDGYSVATRMIGNVLYVASTWAPEVSIYLPPTATEAEVQKALAGLTSDQLLPRIRVDGGAAQPLVAEKDCLLQPQDASLSLMLTTITAIDLSSPSLERSSRCFVGDASALYMSPSSVYLASSRNYWIANVASLTVMPRTATTDIHKFALAGLQVDYRGSGEVQGHLGWDREKAPYRMSEFNGDLRVLSFTGETGWWGEPVLLATTASAGTQAKPSPATLTVLREDTAQRALAKVATLPNSNRPAPIGKEGEQVYAVRFAGAQAYVVTFRRVDPLYVLDLSNPVDPKVAGELLIPGFSDYLYPLADGKLFGVGKEATAEGLMQGLKVALFDVSNPAQPRQLKSLTLGERGSYSALDSSRHGINIFAQGSQVRIALPVRLATTGANSVMLLQQGLARFTVDTQAGTLVQRSMIPSLAGDMYSPAFWGAYNLGNERSLQGTLATYYLTGGQVKATLE